MKRLVMVGLGPVHLHALYAFARQRVASAQVVWVAPSDRAVVPGREASCVAGDVPADDAILDLQPVWRAADVTRCSATVTALDAQHKRLLLSDGRELPYDALSLDLGATVDRDAIVGARQQGLFTRPGEFFLDMVERLLALAQERSLNVVLVGQGAAAFEVALALAHRLRRTGTGTSSLVWVTGGREPLEGFADAVKLRAAALLKRHGVTVLQAACTAIESDHVNLDNGARVICDAPVIALTPQPPTWLADSGLALTESGRVDTHTTFQSTSHPMVFGSHLGAGLSAVGPGDTPAFAAQVAEALAQNLRRYVGSGELLPFVPPARPGAALSCPGQQALFFTGAAVFQGRLAAWWKRRGERSAAKALTLNSSVGR